MPTSLEKWRAVVQDPRVVDFFRGTFERAGVRITDTGEAFTCVHRGDHIDFEDALDESTVEYTVEIGSNQVDRLAEEAAKGELRPIAQYRVLRALFSPATAATLKNPVLSNGILRRLARVEDLIHVHLWSPEASEEPDATHTLIHSSGQWLVIPGLVGKPARVFRISMEDALVYQRRVSSAIKEDTWRGWLRFGLWYVSWRRTTSTRP